MIGMLGVNDPEGHGRSGRAVLLCECRRERARLGIEDEVYSTLAVEGDILGLMLGDCRKAHLLEESIELARPRMTKLHELKSVGSHRVSVRYGGGRCIVRKRSHDLRPS